MVYSMTAFTRQEAQGDFGTFTWELRSVNHRYLEIGARLPEDLRFIEVQVREQISRHLRRGKIECSLRYKAPIEEAARFSLDESIARSLIRLCEEVNDLTHDSAPLNSLELLRWPGILMTSAPDTEKLKTEALATLEKAIDEILITRAREGERLVAFILQRCEDIESILRRIQAHLPQIINRFQERLRTRLETIQAPLDPGRLEQELVLFAQKSDVAEELERLQTHIVEIRQVFKRDEPVGRRLDFLMQELNREANTLGAKSADVGINQDAVELKVLIEQMREQIQNIE